MACQVLDLTFLTTATETTYEYALPSKKFAEALHKVLPPKAMVEFLGSEREFYCTRGIEMYQRLLQINEPSHAGALTTILEQLSSFRMEPTETAAEYKLRLELLHRRLPEKLAYNQALLAHTAYSGLDPQRYAAFQFNVQTGNKSIETVSGLFADLETFESLSLGKKATLPSLLQTPSAKTVAFEKEPGTPASPNPETKKPPNAKKDYDWKGQRAEQQTDGISSEEIQERMSGVSF
jgi:hypothetical protein